MSIIGDRIKEIRKQKGMSQVELSKRSGLAQTTIAWIESGRQERTACLPEIAEALGCGVDELTKDREGKPGAPGRRVLRPLSQAEVDLIAEDPLAAAKRMVAISRAWVSSKMSQKGSDADKKC